MNYEDALNQLESNRGLIGCIVKLFNAPIVPPVEYVILADNIITVELISLDSWNALSLGSHETVNVLTDIPLNQLRATGRTISID